MKRRFLTIFDRPPTPANPPRIDLLLVKHVIDFAIQESKVSSAHSHVEDKAEGFINLIKRSKFSNPDP